MVFAYIGHTTVPGLYKHLPSDAASLNAKGIDVQSIKGLLLMLSSFEDKGNEKYSWRALRLINISFFFELDGFLVSDIRYFAPNLNWLYKVKPRSGNEMGIVTGSVDDWIKLSEASIQEDDLKDFIEVLKQYLTKVL